MHKLEKNVLTWQFWLYNQKTQSYWAIASLIVALMLSFSPDWHFTMEQTIGSHTLSDIFLHYVFPVFFVMVTMEFRREISSKVGQLYGRKKFQPMIMAIGGVITPIIVIFLIAPEMVTPENGLFIAIAFESWGIGKIIFIIVMLLLVFLSLRFDKQIDSFTIAGRKVFQNIGTWIAVLYILIISFNYIGIHASLAGVIFAFLIPYHPAGARLRLSGRLGDSNYHFLE